MTATLTELRGPAPTSRAGAAHGPGATTFDPGRDGIRHPRRAPGARRRGAAEVVVAAAP